LLAAKFRLTHGTFSLEEQQSTPPLKLDEPFTWQAAGQCLGLVSSQADRWHLHVPFWLPIEYDLAMHRRATPLFLQQRYPFLFDQEIEVSLPTGRKVALPAPQENTEAPLRWKIEWIQPGERTILARFQVELARGDLAVEEVGALQSQLGKLLTFLAEGATFGAEF
jgi:hypothetical protein